MSGGGSKVKSRSRTETRLSDELRDASVGALDDATNIYNQGTAGIYQGTRLADENSLIKESQDQLLRQYAEGGDLNNLISQGQSQFQNYLNAGDLENNPMFQRQLEGILDQANVSFQRGAVPLMQQASAAGQFGGSEGQEGLGLLGGEINRNTQQALTNAALGQQQLGFKAQTLLPQQLQMGMMGANVMEDIGRQRTARGQAELLDEIQMYEAGRNAQLQNLQDYYAFLGANPLVAESNQFSSGFQSTSQKQDPLGTLLGMGMFAAGLETDGGGTAGGNFLDKLLGGGSGGGATPGGIS